MSKIRVNQLETLDGTNTVDVADIVDDINTAEVTTSTGTQTLADALDTRATNSDLDTRVEQVDSVSDMLALETASLTSGHQVNVLSYYAPVYPSSELHGGGVFYWDALSEATDNGGTVIEVPGVATGRWLRPDKGFVDVTEWGASPDLSDNTAVYDRIIANSPEGANIKWHKGQYAGHFISSKSFSLDLCGSTFVNTNDTDPVILIEGSSSLLTQVSGTLTYGDREVSVVNASGLSQGDLVYVVDGKVRPSDSTPDINTELLRVASVNSGSNTFTVDDMIRSEQDTGTINLYKINPVVSPSVKNARFEVGSTHANACVFFRYCDNPLSESIETNNTTGRAIDFRHCYNFSALSSRILDPAAAGSGQGYGVAALGSRGGLIRDVHSRGSRHPVDLSSCYNIDIFVVNETSSQLSGDIVSLAHNSFGGNISVENVRASGSAARHVNLSGQGVSDPTSFIAHDIRIKDVSYTTDQSLSVSAVGAYIQTSYDNLIIDGVRGEHAEGDSVVGSIASIVRINGQCAGVSSIDNVGTYGSIGNIVFVNNTSSTSSPTPFAGLLKISNARARVCDYGLRLRGVKHVAYENITCVSTGSLIISVENLNVTNVTNTSYGFVGSIS